MSSEPRLSARGLGKAYRLHDRPLHRLADVAFGIGGGREHWAVRDVDLDLGVGDCVGIVGRNGAGKSTLLELVCGILPPTEGTIETRGRIAALLQLGAGFNPEFTGRENVALGAALYGLSAAEAARRMPLIADFAGIGAAIDRPVREYSSGMYARLAFSVCAHVDADILVVDEILGVGDARFQQRSMRFLREFRRQGIVLFVSHDEHAVAALCRSAIWIEGGRIAATGATGDVLHRYRRELSRRMGPGEAFLADGALQGSEAFPPRVGTEVSPSFDPDDGTPDVGGGLIVAAGLGSPDGTLGTASGGERVILSIECSAGRPMTAPALLFAIRNPLGQIVLSGEAALAAELAAGRSASADFEFVLPFMPTGDYPVELYLLSQGGEGIVCHHRLDHSVMIRILSTHVSQGMANVRMRATELLVGPEAG